MFSDSLNVVFKKVLLASFNSTRSAIKIKVRFLKVSENPVLESVGPFAFIADHK